jgi:IclR family transcriptional regulator, KDG regulon repressor
MKVVKKTLDILEVFLNNRKELGLSELTEITGQNISTVHDILQELLQRGYIRQQYKRGKYSLGPKFLSFSDVINKMMVIEEAVHPFMVKLSKEINETIVLSVKKENHGIVIGEVYSESLRGVLTAMRVGENIVFPLYCTGAGKVLLAEMNDYELNSYFQNEKLESFTPNTITDMDKLRLQLQNIREGNFGFDYEEYILGLSNLAVPLKGFAAKTIAVLGITVLASSLDSQRAKEIASLTKKYASEISKTLGFQKTELSKN